MYSSFSKKSQETVEIEPIFLVLFDVITPSYQMW